MGKFPTKEADVQSLAMTMMTGLTEHATDFPNVDPIALATANTDYVTAKTAFDSAKSAYLVASANKKAKLAVLAQVMRGDIKQAEVDTTDDPQKLYEIGWSPKAEPTPLAAPNAPSNLRTTFQGKGEIHFQWDKPDSGGAVRNYALYRTDQEPAQGLSKWTLVDFFYSDMVTVIDQPVGQQLYYKVTAANAAGTSPESNYLPVVL